MRAFIAIELSKEIKDSLSRLQNKLKASGADVKWVAPQNIHLTLKFLGEIDNAQFDRISQILEVIVKDRNTFLMTLSSIGAFPRINSPRIIWTGVNKGDAEIKEIAVNLEEKIEKIGIPREEKAFSSHITIGRTRSASGKTRLVECLGNSENYFKEGCLEMAVNKITIFKSTLTPKGPIYEILREASLKTS